MVIVHMFDRYAGAQPCADQAAEHLARGAGPDTAAGVRVAFRGRPGAHRAHPQVWHNLQTRSLCQHIRFIIPVNVCWQVSSRQSAAQAVRKAPASQAAPRDLHGTCACRFASQARSAVAPAPPGAGAIAAKPCAAAGPPAGPPTPRSFPSPAQLAELHAAQAAAEAGAQEARAEADKTLSEVRIMGRCFKLHGGLQGSAGRPFDAAHIGRSGFHCCSTIHYGRKAIHACADVGGCCQRQEHRHDLQIALANALLR